MAYMLGTVPADVSAFTLSTWVQVPRTQTATEEGNNSQNVVAIPGEGFSTTECFVNVIGDVGVPEIIGGVQAFMVSPTCSQIICLTDGARIVGNQWQHLYVAYDGVSSRTVVYTAAQPGYSGGASIEAALVKIYINLVSRNVAINYPFQDNPQHFGKTSVPLSLLIPPNTTEQLALSANSPNGPFLNSLQFSAKPFWGNNALTVTGFGITGSATVLGWGDDGSSPELPGQCFISQNLTSSPGDGHIPAGTVYTFNVSQDPLSSRIITEPWPIAVEDETIKIGGLQTVIRYGPFQMYLGQYIAPTADNLSKFVRVTGTRGTPQPLSVARTAFGAPTYEMSGNHTVFVNNTGDGPQFSLVSAPIDFTPGPSYG